MNEPELEVEEQEETVIIAGDNYGTLRVVETSEPYDPDALDGGEISVEEMKKFLGTVKGYRPPYGKNGKSDAAR